MSELLQNWLNNEVGLSTNVSNFEKDFATGYLFGEILHKFRQQDDFSQFQNQNTYEAKIANFKRLEPTFKALGIKFNATQSNAMMNGERGASLRLLYQLKMAAERLVLASSASAETQAGAGGHGAVTKGIRVPRESFDSHERRFFEHRLRATCLNVKQARVDKVTKKFEIEKHKQELIAFEMDNIEQAHIEEQRQIHRFSLRERLRQNKAAKDEWEARGHELWQDNMQVRLAREAADIRNNERVFQKHKDKLIKTRADAALEVSKGFKDFETGLATLGLDKHLEARTLKGIPDGESSEDEDEDNEAERLLAQTTKVSTAKELVSAMESRLPSGQELEHEASLFMRKIKESKHAGNIARRERERRRRRVLVEQQREQEMLEESQLEEVLLEKLGRESVEEAAISYSTWRTRTFEEVFVRNRQARKQEYALRRKKDKEEALQRDQDLRQEMIETIREQEARERVRYRAMERGRHAKRREKLREEMENILELVTEMAFAGLQQEQLTDQEEVDPTLWREWMALFKSNVPVQGLPSLKALSEEPAPLTAQPDENDVAAHDQTGSTLHDAALRDYLDSVGQWEISKPPVVDEEDPDGAKEAPPPVFDADAEAKKVLEEAAEISFVDKLSSELDFVDGRPVNYRLGVVVASLLDRTYLAPPPQPAPVMPEVPLRLVITGKPFSGKRTMASRLAEAYNLQIIDLGDTVRECLHLSKRPDISASNPVDVLSFAGEAADDLCKRHLDAGNPYAFELQEIGYEMQRILDRGEVIHDELYVHMIVTKIRCLFPEETAKQAAAASSSADADGSSGDATAEASGDTSAKVDAGDEQIINVNATMPAGPSPYMSNDVIQPRGWVLVGFPEDANRLALLERFLSGFVHPKARPAAKATEMKAEASLVVPRPTEEEPPLVRQSGGVDLHFRLNLHLDESVRRACGRRVDPLTNLEYHIEDTPPPNEKAVIYERLVPADGLAKSIGTLTQRIHTFDIAQPEVDDFMEYFGPFPDVPRLVEVEATGSADETYEALEEQVALLLERKRAIIEQAKREEEEAKAEAEAAAAAAAAAEGEKASEDGPQDAAAEDPPAAEPPADAAVAETPDATAEPPFEPVTLTDLPGHVQKIEDEVFTMLVEEWRELQVDLVSSLQHLFCWNRSHHADFRSGLYGIKSRFAEYLQRTDFRQGMVDDFVTSINLFTEEYPDMRKQDATKSELHQRADELHERLRTEVESRRTENLHQLEVMQTSRWVESQTEVLASEVQHVVQLEIRRYHAACQLLSDFYYSALCLGLPEAHEPPPKVDCFGVEEEEEVVDPKAKAKAKAKAKGKPAEEEVPEISPEEKAAQRLCKWVLNNPPAEGASAEEPVDPTDGHWEFPFLPDLMSQATKAIWKTEDFRPPSIDVKQEEEAPDPKAKAKAKGKADKKKAEDEAPPPPPQPAPALYVDLQQALLAERVTFSHRLAVIQHWAEKRLLEVATSSKSTFEQLKDWVVLRRQKELDAASCLVDLIKEHVESEDFIRTKLSLENAHLHLRPNVLLRAPPVPVVPPPVEGVSPFRWTIEQLENLLEVIGNAAAAVSPTTRVLPANTMLVVLQQLTSVEGGDRKPVKVPMGWRNCGHARIKQLLTQFESSFETGSIDVVEFLLHIGLLHSPLGWPSVATLMEVRKALEPQAPSTTQWPDFYVTLEQLVSCPLFADPSGQEESFAKKFKPVTTDAPGPFNRSHMQLLWVGQVLRRFMAPACAQEAWELECAWYDYKVRKAEESERWVDMLDDVRSTPSDTPRQPVDPMPALLAHDPDSDNNEDLHSVGAVTVESAGRPEKPRPDAPEHIPEPPSSDSVSVRQLISYLCQGSTAEDGLARAFAVLTPTGSASGAIPAAAAHSAMLQLGARPLQSPACGDARPPIPPLHKFCEELDNKYGGSVRSTDLVGKVEAQEIMKALDLGRRHRRAEVDKIFPKVK